MENSDSIIVCSPKEGHKVEFWLSNGGLYSLCGFWTSNKNQERLLAIGKAMQNYYDSDGRLDALDWFQLQLAKAGLKFDHIDDRRFSRTITVEHNEWEMVLGDYFIRQKQE